MLLPPGGFLVLGFLLSGKRLLDARLQQSLLKRRIETQPVNTTES